MFGIDADYNFTGKRPEIRYIKLGPNNRWAKDALRRGEIPFSFREVPHELALTGDEDRITAHLIGQGKAQGAARNAARQVCAFYGLDEDAVWVTFADGLMWWTTAKREVVWLGESDDYAPRIRRCDGGWSCANRFDVPFEMSSLSSRLTKVASAQATICRIEAEDYLLRKILSVTEPSVRKAGLAKQAMIEAIEELIANLHWSDFETLVDLMLSRSGWHRVSALGGNMKDVDMIVEQAGHKGVRLRAGEVGVKPGRTRPLCRDVRNLHQHVADDLCLPFPVGPAVEQQTRCDHLGALDTSSYGPGAWPVRLAGLTGRVMARRLPAGAEAASGLRCGLQSAGKGIRKVGGSFGRGDLQRRGPSDALRPLAPANRDL